MFNEDTCSYAVSRFSVLVLTSSDECHYCACVCVCAGMYCLLIQMNPFDCSFLSGGNLSSRDLSVALFVYVAYTSSQVACAGRHNLIFDHSQLD